jgi:hypothetical protein
VAIQVGRAYLRATRSSGDPQESLALPVANSVIVALIPGDVPAADKEPTMMLKRLKQLVIGAAVLAGLALGGSASAGAASAGGGDSSSTDRYLTDHEQYVRHHERLASEPGHAVTALSARK